MSIGGQAFLAPIWRRPWLVASLKNKLTKYRSTFDTRSNLFFPTFSIYCNVFIEINEPVVIYNNNYDGNKQKDFWSYTISTSI